MSQKFGAIVSKSLLIKVLSLSYNVILFEWGILETYRIALEETSHLKLAFQPEFSESFMAWLDYFRNNYK